MTDARSYTPHVLDGIEEPPLWHSRGSQCADLAGFRVERGLERDQPFGRLVPQDLAAAYPLPARRAVVEVEVRGGPPCERGPPRCRHVSSPPGARRRRTGPFRAQRRPRSRVSEAVPPWIPPGKMGKDVAWGSVACAEPRGQGARGSAVAQGSRSRHRFLIRRLLVATRHPRSERFTSARHPRRRFYNLELRWDGGRIAGMRPADDS
jgi:hypothetical protein